MLPTKSTTHLVLTLVFILPALLYTSISFNLFPSSVTSERRLVRVQDELPHVTLVFKMMLISKKIYGICSVNDVKLPSIFQGWDFYSSPSDGQQLLIATFKAMDGKTKTVVAIRGSEYDLEMDTVADWINNFQFILSSYDYNGVPSGVKIHQGVKRDLFEDGLYDYVENSIFSLFASNTDVVDNEVYFTGHSAGGLYAQLVAGHFAFRNPTIITYHISFATPRVGNSKYSTWSNNLSNLVSFRIVNRNDLVARLPPKWTGYSHAGHLIQFEPEKTFAYYHQVGVEGSYTGVPNSWNFKSSVFHHSSTRYLRHIVKKCRRNPNKYWVQSFELFCPWYNIFCRKKDL